MAQGKPCEIVFSGGMNNLNTPLSLYLRKKAEVQSLIDADITYPGQLRPLKRLLALNSVAGTNIHSLFIGNGIIFNIDDTVLEYFQNNAFVALLTGLINSPAHWALIGNYLYYANGTNRGCIYIPQLVACGWGLMPPTASPTGNILTGGIATADSDDGAGDVATNAIDGDTTTKWWSNATAFPHWWMYDLGSGNSAIVTQLKIYTMSYQNNNGAGTLIKNFILQGSNDGNTFTAVYTGIAVNAPDKTWQTFSFANTTAYRYYRVYITSNSFLYNNSPSTSWVGFYEVQMMEAQSTTPPFAVAAGSTGLPNGTYYCYVRYKAILPDGTVISTALSPVDNVTVATEKILWTGITAPPAFLGATSVTVDLFRSKVGWASTYLVTNLANGETSFTDNISDTNLQASTYYQETGYWPPPDGINITRYYPAADRVFATIGGDVYWSEAGLYHIFLYDATTDLYQNINSVFLSGDDVTAIKIIDENMYFGSLSTWRRLRGRDPSNWIWEDTAAINGPINDDSACETPFGIIYPGIDGHIWVFNGFDSKRILEEFQFSTSPGNESRATFDGRFYHLFYGDPNYPELVIDFYKYPQVPARIVQSTRSAIAAVYDRKTAQLYISDGKYIRNGDDPNSQVTMSMMTPEIPPEDLTVFGSMGMMIIKSNTQGDNLVITPSFDGKPQPPLTAIVTSALYFQERPISFGDNRVMSFLFSITSKQAFILQEPILLRKE